MALAKQKDSTQRQINITNDLLGKIFILNKQENEARVSDNLPKLNTTEEMEMLLELGYKSRMEQLVKARAKKQK